MLKKNSDTTDSFKEMMKISKNIIPIINVGKYESEAQMCICLATTLLQQSLAYPNKPNK